MLELKARTYIEERLAKGNTLSRLAKDLLPASAGRFRVIPSIESESLDLSYGGVASREESLRDIGLVLAKLLAASPSCAVFENTLARPTDPVIMNDTAGIVTFGAEVYHWLPSGNYSPDEVRLFLRKPRYSVALTGFIGECAWNRGVRVELTRADLAEFVRSVRMIVVSCFDDEGFLLWDISQLAAAPK